MKAQVKSRKTDRLGGVCHGKVHKITRREKEDENVEIKKYLSTLQELVPFMPKSKRLSKLEVISNVIDYIHDLRETLGLPACSASINSESPMTPEPKRSNANHSSLAASHCVPTLCNPNNYQNQRQPLCFLSNSTEAVTAEQSSVFCDR